MGKGSRREREYVDLCKRAGMATYRPATVQYGENDPFGLFDVFALSPSHSAVHAVQVKSNRASGIEAWQRHTALFRKLGMRTFYAVPVDNQGWRVIECKDDVRRTVVDERDSTGVIGDGVVEWLKSLQSTEGES